MKFCLITDTHMGCRNNLSIFNNYFLRFFSEIFFPYLKNNGIDTIVHLGDLTDQRKYCNYNILNSWRRNVFEPLNRDFNTYIINGNHEGYFRNSNEINSLNELLFSYKNIHILNKNIEMDFDGTEILMVPWIVPDKEEETKEILKKTKCQIMMGHIDVIGGEMYKGLVNYDEGFRPEVFEKFDLVLSGHYHHKSIMNGNIHYLGSPYEMIWSDAESQHGFHIFDTEKRELTFIENPLHIFQKLVYNDTDKTYEDLVIGGLSQYKDSYVKIIIESKNNQHLFEQFLEALYKENPADVSIVDAIIESVTDIDSIDESKDTLTLMIEYVEGMNISEENKTPLIDTLKEIYLESMNLNV